MGTRKNRLGEAVLPSIHNLCFGAKIRKIGIALQTPFSLYRSGVLGDIHCTGESSQVLLAGVSGGFSRGFPVFVPPTDWPVSYELK